MADLFVDWLFPPSNTENGEETSDRGCHSNQLESNAPSYSHDIFNVLHAGLHSSLATSDVNWEPRPSNASTYPPDHSVAETSKANFNLSFHASSDHGLAFEWGEQRQNIFQDVNPIMTPSVGYTGHNFK
jgi:hypothetical protein